MFTATGFLLSRWIFGTHYLLKYYLKFIYYPQKNRCVAITNTKTLSLRIKHPLAVKITLNTLILRGLK